MLDASQFCLNSNDYESDPDLSVRVFRTKLPLAVTWFSNESCGRLQGELWLGGNVTAHNANDEAGGQCPPARASHKAAAGL
jgi:hypothetical protein